MQQTTKISVSLTIKYPLQNTLFGIIPSETQSASLGIPPIKIHYYAGILPILSVLGMFRNHEGNMTPLIPGTLVSTKIHRPEIF